MTRSMRGRTPSGRRTLPHRLRATLVALGCLLPTWVIADEPATKSDDGRPEATAASPTEATPRPADASGRPRRGNRPPFKTDQSRVPRPEDPATTGVFGVQGTGRRVVYVIDRSASMGDNGGAALEAARKQVAQSLEELHRGNSFAILFYSTSIERYPDDTKEEEDPLAKWSPDAVRRATDRLDRFTAAGNATHAKAIHDALVMRPDVVFVITDSHVRDDIVSKDRDDLLRLCDGAKIMVAHLASAAVQRCPNLAELAAKSGGRYEALSFDGEKWNFAAGPAAVRADRAPANDRPEAAVESR